MDACGRRHEPRTGGVGLPGEERQLLPGSRRRDTHVDRERAKKRADFRRGGAPSWETDRTKVERASKSEVEWV